MRGTMSLIYRCGGSKLTSRQTPWLINHDYYVEGSPNAFVYLPDGLLLQTLPLCLFSPKRLYYQLSCLFVPPPRSPVISSCMSSAHPGVLQQGPTRSYPVMEAVCK